MYQREVYDEAIRRIKERRRNARLTQEMHTDEIHEKLPETIEIDNQLRTACLSVLQISHDGTEESRHKRMLELQKRTESADAMLRSILTANGYPADYLDIHYRCHHCCDTGFVNGYPCTCLKQELGRVGAERINARAQLRLCTFDTFSIDYYRTLPQNEFLSMQKILHECKEYAASFHRNAGSILMMGNTGLGKTHLSLAIADSVLKKGYCVIYDSAGALLRRIEQEQFGRTPDAADTDTLGLLLECDLLIFDDFGTEFDTTFSRSAIYTLLNGRLSAGKPTIINTNLTHAEIEARYGDRIVSRLFSTCIGMAFHGNDIRLQKRKESFHLQ